VADFTVKELSPDTQFDQLRYWDVVIIGAGPAGLAAGLTTAHRGLTTLVTEVKAKAGGQPQFLCANKRIVDVPGFPDGVTGEELSARVYRQALDARVQFRFNEELIDIEDTDEVEKDDPLRRVVTSGGRYLCRKVIIAMGLLHSPRKLPILEALDSNKVYSRVPNIGDYAGHQVAIVGGGYSALDAAVMVLQRQGAAHVIVREETPIGKADTLARVRHEGGHVHLGVEISAAGSLCRRPDSADVDGQGRDRCRPRHRVDRIPVREGHLSPPERPAQREWQHGNRPVLRDESARHLRGRRRARRHQAHHGGLGGWNPGGDLCVQGDHEPLLAERAAASRSQDRAHRGEDRSGGGKTSPLRLAVTNRRRSAARPSVDRMRRLGERPAWSRRREHARHVKV
jgi:thioredoxin reductase